MFREKILFAIERTIAINVTANRIRKNNEREKKTHVTRENCPSTSVVYW
jgi:hypothetical protein